MPFIFPAVSSTQTNIVKSINILNTLHLILQCQATHPHPHLYHHLGGPFHHLTPPHQGGGYQQNGGSCQELIYSQTSYINQFCAKLCFISEPQVFSCDLSSQIACFDGDFEFHPNSKDKDVHVMDLPLTYSRAIGGTMVIWQSSQSPHIRVLPTLSPIFVSVLLSPLNIIPSV